MTGYPRGEECTADPPKDYSVPLHVDCSIEYELPECAKPPQGVKVEPLLMIHPAHFRRLESLRRVPFVNNLPRGRKPAPACKPARRPHPYRAEPLLVLECELARFERRRALQQLPVYM